MTRFQRGLHADILPLLRTVRKNFTGPNALAEFAEHAAAISASHTVITESTRLPRTRALLVEEYLPVNSASQNRKQKAQLEPVLRAEHVANVSPPSRTATPTVEYSSDEFRSISISARSALVDPFTSYDKTYHTDNVYLVSQPLRQQAPKAQVPRGNEQFHKPNHPSFEAICFECFLPGHRRPLFPT